jgi:Group II intron, maturase-specific domain
VQCSSNEAVHEADPVDIDSRTATPDHRSFAVSTKATMAVSQKIRAWHLSRRSDADLSALAREINPQVRGWIGYN